MYHYSVLLHESVEGLRIHPEGVYVDVTFGGGGHSRQILSKLSSGQLYAFDQDEDATRNLITDPRFTFLPHNFRYLKNFLQLYNVVPVDGILADLGVSSHQFDVPEKGFSIRYDSKLDMRMDQNNPLDALQLINEYSQQELRNIFSTYGELQQAHRIAAAIVSARAIKTIQTTFELRQAVEKLLTPGRENKMLAQIFQAIRMEVNGELSALENFLQQAVQVLKPGGRLVVISYHSLEDRLVKNFIKSGNSAGDIEKDFFGNNLSPMKAIGKVIVPTTEEINQNSRARSAKLRIGEKVIR